MVRGRGDDAAPRLARVTKERNIKTGLLIPYSKRFYHLGVSGLKMALYRDLQKTDPEQPGCVAFPSGLDDEYFQELVSERRTAVKRNGFTVYRWTKDDRQDNEALDTMIQATGAALRFGAYGLSDVGWAQLESERGRPAPPPARNEVRIVTAEPPSPAWARVASLNQLTIAPTESPSSEFRTPDRR
jgi:phage terminase large subunit GpA-like protein